MFVLFEQCQSDWRKYYFCLTLLINKSCECVYKRERNWSNRNVAAMSLTLVKQSRCVLLKETSDSYCVYKVSDAVLASFMFAIVRLTVRRHELHRGFSVGIIRHCMLVLYTYYIIYYCLFIYCRFLLTIGLNYIMQNQFGLNSRDVRSGGRAEASCEGELKRRVRAS